MPCYHPMTAYRPKEPGITGKRPVSFKISKYHSEAVQLPCGQCIGCRLEKSRQWSIRIMHEAQLHDSNSFITLTYTDQNIPKNASLDKADLQKFFKRLRKKTQLKIRYYACGEYGEKTDRPHYHACIFGYDFPDKTPWTKNNNGDILYRSPELEKIWGLGQCLVGQLTVQSAGYTARYVMKKLNGKRAKEKYQSVDSETGEIHHRIPEYSAMSRRPGIAAKWYDQFKSDLYPSDSVIHNTRETKVPAYYDRLLEAENPELLEKLKESRKDNAEKRSKDNTPARRKVRERVKNAQIKNLKRTEL